MYYQICKNAGTCTDDSNLYFEPKDAAAELYVLGISPDVSFFQATETI